MNRRTFSPNPRERGKTKRNNNTITSTHKFVQNINVLEYIEWYVGGKVFSIKAINFNFKRESFLRVF